jgi:peptide/nickel transport system permease protein
MTARTRTFSATGVWLRARRRSPLLRSFLATPSAVGAAIVLAIIALSSLFASWIAPHTPFDPATVNLIDALTPPFWMKGGDIAYPLGTDQQGRDILSIVLYGGRVSLEVGLAAVAIAMVIGATIGLLAGYVGGWFESVSMRIVDIQLTIPSILLALLINGAARAALPRELHNEIVVATIIIAIAAANWPPFARVARSRALVERNKEYVQAARIIGVSPLMILIRHVLPNAMGPMLVIATIDLGLAVLTEAALSFLGVGIPPTQPSLGTLIRIGGDFLFSGELWIFMAPAAMLVALVLSVNLLGDWLRDALNPKLRRRA